MKQATARAVEGPRASASRPPGLYWLLVTVSLGAMLAPLNSTMLAVALPALRRDFEVSHAAVGWLVSSYLIAMAVTQPLGGRLGDQLGRPQVFRTGLIAFLVFSVASALAPTFAALLAFRTLQAVSGAILIPNAIGMLRETVPSERFGRFSGLNSAVIGATAAAGPVLGGAVLALGSWRWMFAANLPVVAAALILATRLPADNRGAGRRRAGFDWLGALLFAVLLCVLTVLLNALKSGELVQMALEGAALLVLAALFAWRQRATATPTAEWRLFRKRSFVGASTHILLMNLAMYTTLLAVPFFLTEVQLRSSTVAGLLLGCMAALQAVTAPFAGWGADSFGRRRLTLLSSAVALAASLLLVFGIGKEMPLGFLAVVMLLLGFGVGMGFVSATTAAIESAPRSLAGSAAGTQSMMRYLGSIVGAGVLAGLLDTNASDIPSIAVFRALFIVVAAMAALSLVSATLIRPFAEDEKPA